MGSSAGCLSAFQSRRIRDKQELGKGGEAKQQRLGHEARGQYSPAQVAVHGLHIVVLATCERAQLVEGHPWRETEVMWSAAMTQHC